MAKLHDLGVAEAANAIRTGDIKAEALADALLARAAAHAESQRIHHARAG